MKILKIDHLHENQRIDKYLNKLLPNAPKGFVYKMLRKKDVKVNGKRVKENYIVQYGDEVSLFLYDDRFIAYSKETTIYELPIQFKVIYEDEHILIVDKPVGLLVQPDDHEDINVLSNQVLTYLYRKGEYDPQKDLGFTPGPVHRLDRNTSGLVIYGKDMRALQDLNEMMKKRHCIDKKYVHPLRYGHDVTLVEVSLVTGRTHQIRVHLASQGHPVMGDRKYGDFSWNREIAKKYKLNNQFLHAYSLTFTNPFGSMKYLKDKTFISPLSGNFKKIVDDLF
ncbi:RluA family pseudouridine synthase [uncultured Sharpea sp.]|uniref:RluA family pseudouridine synthase n=1 Tax=uncultured Sharpea sp. TaxID=1112738 RepID=UPI00258ED336|nr:RluA family pseudouridine synthase [uncultured Sharpea sp.]